jgi:hypothetical protein
VGDAGVVHELIGDTPASGRGAVAAPVVVLECDAPWAQLLDAAEKRERDLRKLVVRLVTGHAGEGKRRPRLDRGASRSGETGQRAIITPDPNAFCGIWFAPFG